MSSWTNNDLYVAYGFGSSNVNGYYFPDTTENYWQNSSNNISLVYGGTHWWLRETNPTTYVHYYYGATDNGSGICNNLIFASNSVYGACTGEFPIGNIIYGGTVIASSSSSHGISSSSSSESDSLYANLYCLADCIVASVNGTYTKTDSHFNDRPVYYNGVNYMYWQLYSGNYFWVINSVIADEIDVLASRDMGENVPEGIWYELHTLAQFTAIKGSCESTSSSSSTSLSTSSSSSSFVENLELFHTLVNQGHHDILPFSFIIEKGQESNGTLGFSYLQTSNTLSYKSLLDFNTVYAETTASFVPETKESKYKHEPIFYADIMVEGQGVNEYSLRSQQNAYIKEKPSMTFNIPKFTWDNSIFGVSNESESSVNPKEGYIWMGTNNNNINKVYYSIDSARLISTSTAPSEVYRLTIGQKDNKMFVSCYDNLVVYTNTSYYSGNDDFHEDKNILNGMLDLVDVDDINSGYLITTEAYQGNVVFRDRDTLETVAIYSGFDAPFKVLWSKAHNGYLIAGTYTLWKLIDGQKTAAYNIKGYSIVDFDCSEKGVVSIIFKSDSNYIIRFLDKNLYTIIYNEVVTDKDVRYCRYCEQGKFYILQEIIGGEAYSTVSYLFDSISKTLVQTESINTIVTTTMTTTSPIPSSTIEIIDPNVSTIWQKGNSYDIKWLSKASIADLVKIELYNGIKLIDVIAEETLNTGIFVWNVPTTYDNGSNYKIKVMWLSAGDNTQFDVSETFTLTDIPQTTTTTTTKILDRAIGVEYNNNTEQVVIVLSNGLIAIYDLEDYSFNGLIESGISNVKCIAVSDRKTNKFSGVSKVRVYVGDKPRLSNKWDSGIITTEKTSMYYGGGNNLVPGNKYYVNIQVYSDKYGWSEIQIKEFIMPK